MTSPRFTLVLFLALLALAACGGPSEQQETVSSVDVPPPLPAGETAYAIGEATPIEARVAENWSDLHNVLHLSDAIVSGSEPHGQSALQRIADMGVKTILSVDGKAPEVELAAKLGMRYVHVPIQYSGIDAGERMRIAKTFRELEGPFYVHCFHGVHRGPAAAALGRVVLDGVERAEALAEMKQWAGTSKKYQGLYETVGRAPLPSAEESASYAWDFPGAHEFEGFRGAMIGTSRVFEHLKAMAGRDWGVDPEHPDLHAGNEVDQLVEIYAATVKLDDLQGHPEDLQQKMAAALASAEALQTALRHLPSAEDPAEGRKAASAAFAQVKADCNTCHVLYRNTD